MVHRSMDNLKFDKRLSSRRGWVEPAEKDAHEKALSDVAEKGERVDVESAQRASGPSGEGASEPSEG